MQYFQMKSCTLLVILCLSTSSLRAEVTPSHSVTDEVHKFINHQIQVAYQNESAGEKVTPQSNKTEGNRFVETLPGGINLMFHRSVTRSCCFRNLTSTPPTTTTLATVGTTESKQQEEKHSSFTIFFILFVLGMSETLPVHMHLDFSRLYIIRLR